MKTLVAAIVAMFLVVGVASAQTQPAKLVHKEEIYMSYKECKQHAQLINSQIGYNMVVVFDDPNPQGKTIGFLGKFYAHDGEVSIQCIGGKKILRQYKYN